MSVNPLRLYLRVRQQGISRKFSSHNVRPGPKARQGEARPFKGRGNRVSDSRATEQPTTSTCTTTSTSTLTCTCSIGSSSRP
jgi:hypothetical protein